MYLLYLLLLVTPLTLTVNGMSLATRGYGIFDIMDSVSNGLASVGNFIYTLNDIFSVVLDEGNPDTPMNQSIVPEDARLNIRQLTQKYGYPFKAYTVTTEDGYNLELQRISCANCNKTGPVVFLMHGILDSSDSWVIQGPEKALGYILADEGFDVWMGNARGNKYSLSHTSLSPKHSDFWEFTWEEIGVYDITAMLDYVLEKTGTQSVYFIGHSQGTTSFFVMNSLKPEYNNKVKLMFSLAPVAWMRNVKSPLVRMFSPGYKLWGYFLSTWNTYSPTTEFLNKVTSVACSFLPVSCDDVLSLLIGRDYKHLDKSFLPVILGHLPTGSSTAQFVHYGQLVDSGRFARFNFGREVNFQLYNQSTPPDYDLTKITTPISVFYSDTDWFSDSSDVELLKSSLPNVFESNRVDDYNHLEFMYASNAKDVIYSRIIKQIYKVESKY